MNISSELAHLLDLFQKEGAVFILGACSIPGNGNRKYFHWGDIPLGEIFENTPSPKNQAKLGPFMHIPYLIQIPPQN